MAAPNRKQDAANLRDSELLREVLAQYRELLLDRWQSTAVNAVADRERVFAGITSLKELTEFIDDGIAAALGDERAGPDTE